MKLKYISISVIIITLVLITSACTLKDSDDIENQIMKRVPFPQSTIILHTENINDGEVILYEDKSGLRAALISAKDDHFLSTSNAEVSERWVFLDDEK